MKRFKTVVIGVLAVSMVALVGYVILNRESKAVGEKPNQPKIAGKYDFAKAKAGDWIPTDWYSWGEAADDTRTAAKVVGHEVFTARVLDDKYLPVVRLDRGFGSIAIVYPNGVVITAVPQKPTDPGMDFAETVTSLNKKNAETGSAGGAILRKNGPYEGLVIEKGTNDIGGEKVPHGGFVTWYRDGILYNVFAPPEISQDEVEDIAASAL